MHSNLVSEICLLFVIILCTISQISSQERDSLDLCKTNPCANKGHCVQTNVSPGYKCQCHGTGFFGPRCKQACNKANTNPSERTRHLPIECIII